MADGENMSDVLSNSIVVIAIVVSLGYAVWRLGPRKMRDALRARFNLKAGTGSGCDACGGCPPATTDQPAPAKEHGVFWRKSTR
jgi:hypothetical protein